MLNKKPKRRSNVKKSRRRRRKNNPNVMKKWDKRTIEKKDSLVNCRVSEATMRKLHLYLVLSSKPPHISNQSLRPNRQRRNLKKPRRKKRRISRNRKRCTQKNKKSYVSSKNWTVSNC
jgi:hypothetical protein